MYLERRNYPRHILPHPKPLIYAPQIHDREIAIGKSTSSLRRLLPRRPHRRDADDPAPTPTARSSSPLLPRRCRPSCIRHGRGIGDEFLRRHSLPRAEFNLLSLYCPSPSLVAFVGSGPLPLTSIALASNHLKTAVFHNYDVDESANELAEKLVSPHPDLSDRMEFRTTDIVDAPGPAIREYDVVFLAALIGTEIEEKRRAVEYLAEHMRPGAVLVVRSVRGARAFLYPVVGARDLEGFEVLSVYHRTDDVINSVVVARKYHDRLGNCVDNCGEVPLISQMKMVLNS